MKKAEKLKLKFTRVTLADVLEKVSVSEVMSVSGDSRSRIYGLNFDFLPRFCYKDRYCVKPKQVFIITSYIFFCNAITVNDFFLLLLISFGKLVTMDLLVTQTGAALLRNPLR